MFFCEKRNNTSLYKTKIGSNTMVPIMFANSIKEVVGFSFLQTRFQPACTNAEIIINNMAINGIYILMKRYFRCLMPVTRLPTLFGSPPRRGLRGGFVSVQFSIFNQLFTDTTLHTKIVALLKLDARYWILDASLLPLPYQKV